MQARRWRSWGWILGIAAGLWLVVGWVCAASSGAVGAVQQTIILPALVITQPQSSMILTQTPQRVGLEYDCGDPCIVPFKVEVTTALSGSFETATPGAALGRRLTYGYLWSLPDEDYVTHTLLSRATVADGTSITTSAPVSVVVDVRPPHSLTLHAPTRAISPQFQVAWGAVDGSGDLRYDVQYRLVPLEWRGWMTQSRAVSAVFSQGMTATVARQVYEFRVRALDQGGNLTAWETTSVVVAKPYIYLPLVLRGYPPIPHGHIAIEGGPHTYTPRVRLTLTATVAGGDEIAALCLSQQPECHVWRPYTQTVDDWELSGGSGLKTVYAYFRGKAGGVSPAVQARVYLALNGNFEVESQGWQGQNAGLPWRIVESIQEHPGLTAPVEGRFAAQLGEPAYACIQMPLGYAEVKQTFQIPAEASELVFQYLIWTQDQASSAKYDRFEVYINGTLVFEDGNRNAGLNCAKWWRVPGPENPRGRQTDGWATARIPLAAYRGQTVTIAFQNHSRYDQNYNTYSYIDAVHIEGQW